MSLAESPSPSSSSGSDDFAGLLDAELELASAADSAALGEDDDEQEEDLEGEEEEEEDDEVVVEVEGLERGYVPPSPSPSTY
jgi:RNA polymerase II C-terminal domain phosphatase-like 3/4